MWHGAVLLLLWKQIVARGDLLVIANSIHGKQKNFMQDHVKSSKHLVMIISNTSAVEFSHTRDTDK